MTVGLLFGLFEFGLVVFFGVVWRRNALGLYRGGGSLVMAVGWVCGLFEFGWGWWCFFGVVWRRNAMRLYRGGECSVVTLGWVCV